MLDTDTTAKKGVVSLADFTHFHGMLCSPATASRCIQAFAGGTILFAPSHYTAETLSLYDYSAKGVLRPFTYYMLVLSTMTGLSTLLGMTDFRMAQEFEETRDAEAPLLKSKHNSMLRIEPYVLDYCKQHTGANTLVLKRRFEFRFKLVGLDVVMLHFFCNQNKLHLVEVYHCDNWVFRETFTPLLVYVSKVYRGLMRKYQWTKSD